MEVTGNQDRAKWRTARMEALRKELRELEDECVQEALSEVQGSDLVDRCGALWDKGLRAQAAILYRTERGGSLSVAKATVEGLMCKRDAGASDGKPAGARMGMAA